MTSKRATIGRGHEAISIIFVIAIVAVACGAGRDKPGVRELGKIMPKELREISGVAASRANPGVLWVSNDGDARWLYAVYTTGKQAGAAKMPARITDVEEVSIGVGPKPGTDYLYIGDIGDNDLRRFEVAVVRFPEPAVAGDESVWIDPESVEQFRLAYPDRAHNAEAMFIDPTDGTLYIVTKDERSSRLYEIGSDAMRVGERNVLRFVGEIAVDRVSAGTISPDGSWILLRREDRGWLWRRQPGQSLSDALQGPPQLVPVRGPRQGPNGEAIGFRPDGVCYYTLSEGKKPAICEFDIPAAEQ